MLFSPHISMLELGYYTMSRSVGTVMDMNKMVSQKKHLLRAATQQDLAILTALEQRCYHHPWSQDQFLEELDNPISSIFIYGEEQRISGYLCFWLIAGEMQILKITTCPSLRRQGVAATLLGAAFLKNEEIQSAWLEVRQSNVAAIALYHSFEFRCEGTRKSYYRNGEDALLMVKRFA
jgi:ribosomal-protein-alanine N-acetyltransferase